MIRAATVDDAAGIARVHVRSWRRAYADIMDPEVLAALSVEEHEQRWRGLLCDARSRAWVCEVDEAIAGFASVRDGELTTLYVDPAAQGAGAGTALLHAAERAGARTLCVLAANEHARRFYERHGWRAAGPVVECHGEPAVRYERCANPR